MWLSSELLEWKMPRCNILIGCDQKYYDDWGINLIRSIKYFNPWITCHVHVVNPIDLKKIPGVEYTTEQKEFPNDTIKIGYLQSVRFLKVAEKFNDNDLVMTIDTDTICTRKTTPEEFISVASKITVLRHLKDYRWLAGLVTYGSAGFKKDFADRLLAKPFEQWAPFHDQNILDDLSKVYTFHEQEKLYWMSIGKNGHRSIFLTLKGSQKFKEKYLMIYNSILNQISVEK